MHQLRVELHIASLSRRRKISIPSKSIELHRPHRLPMRLVFLNTSLHAKVEVPYCTVGAAADEVTAVGGGIDGVGHA